MDNFDEAYLVILFIELVLGQPIEADFFGAGEPSQVKQNF